MPGSDAFCCTTREQEAWAKETAKATTFFQIAVVYRGREVAVERL